MIIFPSSNSVRLATNSLYYRYLQRIKRTLSAQHHRHKENPYTVYAHNRFFPGGNVQCEGDKEDITWPRVDMNFIFSCSTRYLTRSRISTSGHVIFCLLYKHRINSCEKGAIYYVTITITTVISSRVKITCYLHVWRYEVFAGKLTWYFTGVHIIKTYLVMVACTNHTDHTVLHE